MKKLTFMAYAAVAATVFGFAVSAQAANGNLVQDSDGYYKIDDYADLQAFARTVNGGEHSANGKLTADIAATGTDWTPIGNDPNCFAGVFDGQGHTIAGLDNTGASSSPLFAGLFGHVLGTVRNVGVVGGNIQSSAGNAKVGGIAGDLDLGTVENCFFSGSVTAGTSEDNSSYSGGIVGLNFGVVRNCHSTASLRGYHVGGIAGVMYEGSLVKTCCFAGYRPGDSSYHDFGAIVGNIAGNGQKCTVSHCYYNGQMAAPGVGVSNGASVSTVVGLLTQYFTAPVYFAGLDFTNAWYMGESGPMLRAFLKEYPYADPADEAHSVKTAACIPVTANTTTLRSDWYVVNSSVALSGRIAVEGDANLLLGDGCVLYAYGGIELTGTNRLTVWCQGGGSGTLIANGRDDNAAIGGNGAQPGGALTIHGGTVTATASGAGAGIGGGGSAGNGDAGDGGTVKIYGGTVRAVSEGAGAGIGGGGISGLGFADGGKGGTVILYGGTVTAGSEDGVAIGGGKDSGDDADGAIYFAGHLGVVASKWESHLASAQPVDYAERAAACHSSKWAKVSPCQRDHASLAGPCPVCGLCPPVSYIDPADMAEKTRTDCIAVFDDTEMLTSGWYAPAGNLTLHRRLVVDGDVNLILVDGATITAGQGIRVAAGSSLAIWWQSGQSGELVAMNDNGGAAIGDGLGDGNAGSLAIGGIRVYANETAAEPVAAAQRESVCRGEWARLVPCKHTDYDLQGVCLVCGLGVGPVSYLDPTDADSPDKFCVDYSNFTTHTTLATGWHVVRGKAQIGGRVEVVGDVNLILCDGVELTAAQGFHVTGTNSLTVWAQSTDPATAGKLVVTSASDSAAGIGGNSNEENGIVTVNGGELTVTGGQHGAGIGGGVFGSGGTLTINGGTVTATGGQDGAGIGGGDYGSGGTLTINGGTVTATGGQDGAGIGGGDYGSGGTLTINGGTVTATGGQYGAGIGGGIFGSGGSITINGGAVTAVAGGVAQAIGHGRGKNNAGSLVLDGMRVFASASATEPVSAAEREDTCRSGWAKAEVCPHGGNGSSCPWCGVVFAYAAWASTSGVTGAWDATDDLGVHNVFRYAFDKPFGAFTNPPLLSITFDASGNPVVLTPPLVNGEGFDLSILATDTLAGDNPATYPLDPSGTNAIPASAAPSRFFRLRAEGQ